MRRPSPELVEALHAEAWDRDVPSEVVAAEWADQARLERWEADREDGL